MPWQVICHIRDPLDHNCGTEVTGTYDTQALARWWAVNLLQRGSININQGQPDEYLLPSSSIMKVELKEI